MTDLQVAHHLLRCCLDASKVTHLLRASDCYTSDAGVREAEMHILTGFEDIIGQALPGAEGAGRTAALRRGMRRTQPTDSPTGGSAGGPGVVFCEGRGPDRTATVH